MSMETRKLQQVGGGTYTISIPKGWAVERDLEAGSEIHLYSHTDGSIIVRHAEKDGENLDTIRVDIDGEAEKLVTRALRAAHAIGFETVTLRTSGSFTDAQRRAARRAKRHLVGTELIAETGDTLTFRNLLDASNVSIRQSVVQLQFVARSIHRQATTAFADANPLDHARLSERADEADRLEQMITRHFSRSQLSMDELDRLGVSRSQLFDYYSMARALRRATELSVTIGDASDQLSGPLCDTVAADFEAAADDAGRVVQNATTAVLEGLDVTNAHAVLDRRDETIAAIHSIERAVFDDRQAAFDIDEADVRPLTRGLDALTQIATCGGEIAEVAVRGATRVDCC